MIFFNMQEANKKNVTLNTYIPIQSGEKRSIS